MVKVSQNAAEQSITPQFPSPQKGIVVHALQSGEFEDLEDPGRKVSDRLRLDLLYVDWDDTQRVWRQPEPDLKAPGVAGHFTISSHDLRNAITALENELNRRLPQFLQFS
jgi:hypothetical protein